jgi:hypothetical protein
MSTQNQINIEIPQAIIDDVVAKLKECKTALAPYLQGLTAKERQEFFKMGDKTVATVQKTKTYVDTNPEFAPSYLDKPSFLKDVAVVTQLLPVVNLATQLATDADDTLLLAGSEALQSAMLYYGQIREANSKGVPTAKPIYEDLSERFKRGAYKNKTD